MGKVKGKIVKTGDKGCLKVKPDDGGPAVQYDYDQPFSAEMGIVEGAVVTCSLVTVGSAQIAVSVAPCDKGEIRDIDYENGTGTIFEKESGISYPFMQNYLKESTFANGDTVKYTIVRSKEKNYAACLVKPVPAS